MDDNGIKEHVSELTPEEFQKTFPITLEDVRPEYSSWFEEERASIEDAVGKDSIVRINHIGSSAIPGIKAKPVVDILLELDGTSRVDEVIASLKRIGFGTEIAMRKDNPFEFLLAKGMTVKGFDEKVFLMHVRYAGDWSELYFRDYLLDNPDVARKYSDLKVRILDDISAGRLERMPNGQPNGYSNAKYKYVDELSKKAKSVYPGRYKIS